MSDPSSQPLTDEGPASDRDKGDMIAARREVQAVLDGRLPMDNAAYSAAIVMVLWKAGWRPRHLSTSMDRCDIADGWWRIGQQWRQKYNEAQSEVDRLRAENEVLKAAPEIIASPDKSKRIASLVASSTRLVQIERDDARRENTILALNMTAARDCVKTARRCIEDDLPRAIQALDMAASALGLNQDGEGQA